MIYPAPSTLSMRWRCYPVSVPRRSLRAGFEVACLMTRSERASAGIYRLYPASHPTDSLVVYLTSALYPCVALQLLQEQKRTSPIMLLPILLDNAPFERYAHPALSFPRLSRHRNLGASSRVPSPAVAISRIPRESCEDATLRSRY